MSVYTLLNSTRNTESRTSGADKYPTSEDAWKNRYNWLHDAYTGEPYQLQDMTAWRLFRAFDTNGNVMAETTRLLRDNAFVIDQDAGALFGAGATLETQDRGIRSARRSLDAGEKIWKRSMLGERLSTYALSLASMGRIGLEVVRTEAAKPWGVTIVAHDPRNYVVTYDVATGLRIERVTITQQVFRTDEIDGSGNVADATLDVHQRELTAEGIRVTLNGEEVRKETGEHRLGAVPFCNLLWQEYREPEHGLHAAHGMERGIALLDSLITQIQAVGNRYGDPKLFLKGAKFGADTSAITFGRAISGIPADGELGYLEPTMSGVKALLDALGRLNAMTRETFPEFSIFGGGAAASGEALRYRGEAFVRKLQSARGRAHPQVARAIGMGVAMAAGVAYDPDAVPFRLECGPVLPVDTDADLARVHDVKMRSGFRLGDYTRHLQRLGLVGVENDPVDYEIAAQDEGAAVATEFLTRDPKPPAETPAEPETEDEDDGDDDTEG